MESVTLGVVGDSFSGKTLLATSYTANYVYKQYKATVLNCHWTNAVVDGKVIDVTIWDSSGSDEYNKLRPLSYLQTNVFLVCFSLKNRTSFENIERKWIPEVKKHNADAKFLIVGCKRDPNRCNMPTIKARFTSCDSPFETIKNKFCASPSYSELPGGNITSVIHTHNPTIYTVGATVTYTCDLGLELYDNTSAVESTCQQNNQWTNFTNTCINITCPVFSANNGTVNFTSLLYNRKAMVTCDPGNYADNGETAVNVTCQLNKQWTSEPECRVDNIKSRYRNINYQPGTRRTPTQMKAEVPARSVFDCAITCTEDATCTGANFKGNPSAGGICRLFIDSAESFDMSVDSAWKYMHIDD